MPEISKIMKANHIPMIIDTTLIPWFGFDARLAGIKGYYTAEQMFVALAFIVLLRVKNLDCSQGIPYSTEKTDVILSLCK